MKAKSINEAWEMAKELVKDAQLDTQLTENAGYKVYQNEEGEWISDLGERLECNIVSGKTINIWIEKDEKIQIGMGHMIRGMQLNRFGHTEIMAMREAMLKGDFTKIEFCEDCYTEDWKEV
jgi:hypothetical protein